MCYKTNLRNQIILFLFFVCCCKTTAQTSFEEKLAQLGIDIENVTDWSDSVSITWPMPQCAYVNLTGISKMPPKKTSNYHAWVEVYDGQGNYFKKRAVANLQGRGSTVLAKKNFKLDFCNDEWVCEDTPDMTFGDWVEQDGFHYKAFYLDLYRGIGIMGYRVYDLITQGRGQYGRIWERANLSKPDERALCHPDAFPCVVYLNGEFHGLFCWQLKKHRKNMNMKKNTPEHIHVEGTPLTGDTFFHDVIDWSAIEVRNPKNLYCMDGSVYSDTNLKELMDESSPYFNLDSDDAQTKKYKQNTAKVKRYILKVSHYYTELDSLASSGASKAKMREEVEKRFDVPSLIDYIIHNLLTSNGDGLRRNFQWFTYDGEKWFVAPYDLDGIFGYFVPYGYGLFEPGYFQTNRIQDREFNSYNGLKWGYKYFRQDIYNYYAFLRNNGFLNSEIISNMFDQWYHLFGESNYADEWIKWPDSQCLKETIPNEPWELCPFAQPEYSQLSEYSSTKYYEAGDKCRAQSKIWRAKSAVTGVRPYKQMGSKDSLSRIGYYLPIHFAALDQWMRYNQQSQPESYSLDLSIAGWTTLCVPFSFDIPDGLILYSVVGTRRDGKLSLAQCLEPEPNKPYLVRGTPGKYIITGISEEADGLEEGCYQNELLYGVHSGRYAPKGTYVLQNQNGKVAFYLVKEDNTVHVGDHKAWLAFDNESGTAPSLFSFDEEETNIVEMADSHLGHMNIFNIDGTPMQELKKGINIIRFANGKTVKKVIK